MFQNKTLSVLFLITVVCVILNLVTLYDGHNWGGDFAQYILHAQNLLAGKPYNADIMLEGALVYPPGFPLMIAPLLKIWGVNFFLLKILNVFCWAGCVPLVYAIAREITDSPLGLLCAALISSSSVLFAFKQNILSDIPFLFFVLSTILALMKKRLPLALGLLFVTVLLRSAGLALSVGVVFYYLAIERNFKHALMLLAVSILGLLASHSIAGGLHPAFFNGLNAGLPNLPKLLANYSPTTWQSLAWSMVPGQTRATSLLFLLCSWAAVVLSPFLWIGVPWVICRKFQAKTLTIIDCFLGVYFPMLL